MNSTMNSLGGRAIAFVPSTTVSVSLSSTASPIAILRFEMECERLSSADMRSASSFKSTGFTM